MSLLDGVPSARATIRPELAPTGLPALTKFAMLRGSCGCITSRHVVVSKVSAAARADRRIQPL